MLTNIASVLISNGDQIVNLIFNSSKKQCGEESYYIQRKIERRRPLNVMNHDDAILILLDKNLQIIKGICRTLTSLTYEENENILISKIARTVLVKTVENLTDEGVQASILLKDGKLGPKINVGDSIFIKFSNPIEHTEELRLDNINGKLIWHLVDA